MNHFNGLWHFTDAIDRRTVSVGLTADARQAAINGTFQFIYFRYFRRHRLAIDRHFSFLQEKIVSLFRRLQNNNSLSKPHRHHISGNKPMDCSFYRG